MHPFLFVLLHSRATQDDPNAWSYDCTVDGESFITKVLLQTLFLYKVLLQKFVYKTFTCISDQLL